MNLRAAGPMHTGPTAMHHGGAASVRAVAVALAVPPTVLELLGVQWARTDVVAFGGIVW